MILVAGLLGILLLVGLLKILSVSVKVISKLVVNSISGVILLLIFNLVGSIFSTSLEINFVNSLVAGFFGIPGVIILLLLNL